jgi:hypothetical protein
VQNKGLEQQASGAFHSLTAHRGGGDPLETPFRT